MIAGLAVAVVIAAGAVVVNQLPARTNANGAAQTSSASAPASTATRPRTTGAPTGAAAKTQTDAPGPLQSKRFTTEVLPGGGAAGALPKSTPLPYPLSGPLPEMASAVGSIAKGYPSEVAPVAPHSAIATTSVASQGTHLQVTLTANSTMSVISILAFYRTTFAKYGMYDTPAPALGGSTALAFTRGSNSVTLTVTPIARGSSYVLYGAFTATN